MEDSVSILETSNNKISMRRVGTEIHIEFCDIFENGIKIVDILDQDDLNDMIKNLNEFGRCRHTNLKITYANVHKGSYLVKCNVCRADLTDKYRSALIKVDGNNTNE